MKNKNKLKELIQAILTKSGTTAKVKLAKLVLFSEIEYFKKYNQSITGCYFVRLKNGPVVSFYDEVLDEEEGILWAKEYEPIYIISEDAEKKQISYSIIKSKELSKEEQDIVENVVRKYGKKTGTQLSELSHNLPAWKHSEPNEPIYMAELIIDNESEYFALTDLIEDIEDEAVDEELSQTLCRM